jgi:alpha-glucosidase
MRHLRHFVIALTLASCPTTSIAAQPAGWQTLGAARGVQRIESGVEITCERGVVRVVAIDDSIVRVRVTRSSQFPVSHSWAVVAPSKPVRLQDFRDSSPEVSFATRAVRIRVAKATLAISFAGTDGAPIAADNPSRPMLWNGSAFQLWKQMPPDEHYFGLGDKAGPLDHRGMAFTMWNTDAYGWTSSTDPLYKTIPFFLAMNHGRAYGIFLDNTWRSFFDFGKQSRDAYSFGADGGELDYYFIAGPAPKDVIERFTALTGRTPLPPLFALGYQQSRWSYPSEARVREVANKFRQERIPADAIYLDIEYQDGNRPFTIDRAKFPHFEQMVHDLGGQGFKVVAITDLHLKQEPGYAPYDEGIAGDHFVKNADGSVYVGKVWPGASVFPDFTRAETRRWWGTLYRGFAGMGVRGFWNDMNEPAIFDVPGKTMPLDTMHRVAGDGLVPHSESHRAIHNVFGMENVRATYEGLLALNPNQRPFVLTRAAYAGTQRYAATWTGDNSSTWEHMRQSVPQLLNLGLSGYPLSGADVGGFIGSPTPDLLTRWIELGAFLPLFRNHTSYGTADQEPWVHGPEHEAIRRRYIELRYQLLPYIYTAMEQTARTGVPLVRPLFLEYPAEEDFAQQDREFLLGDDLLIAPALSETFDQYPVRLPAGDWYDYWSGKKIAGGSTTQAAPALDHLPIYVRAGAIIPMQPVVQSTSEKPQGPLQLWIYRGQQCRGSAYADDGETLNYTRGDFSRTDFACSVSSESIEVTVGRSEGQFIPWWDSIQVHVVGVTEPQAVSALDGPAPKWAYDSATQQLTFELPRNATRTTIQLRRP